MHISQQKCNLKMFRHVPRSFIHIGSTPGGAQVHTQSKVGEKTGAQVYLRMQHISGGKELFI